MSLEDMNTNAPAPTDTPVETTPPVDTNTPEPSSYEAEAREQGWRPKEE